MLEILFPQRSSGPACCSTKTAEVRFLRTSRRLAHAAALGHFEAHERRGCGEAGQALATACASRFLRRSPMKKNTTPSPDADAPMGYGTAAPRGDLPRHRR